MGMNIGTREEWRSARIELLAAEKEHTRRSDELARMRQALPWVPVEQEYVFDTVDGPRSLVDLFGGRSQLLVQHLMFPPTWDAPCPSCSSIADGWRGIRIHLEHHDVAMVAVSRAPLPKLVATQERLGWDFPWVSSAGTTFNRDHGVSFTAGQIRSGPEYNFRRFDMAVPDGVADDDYVDDAESPGTSAFALVDGVAHHTYAAYARGVDGTWGMYQWLDRAPLGRNEEGLGLWFKRRDEYPS